MKIRILPFLLSFAVFGSAQASLEACLAAASGGEQVNFEQRLEWIAQSLAARLPQLKSLPANSKKKPTRAFTKIRKTLQRTGEGLGVKWQVSAGHSSKSVRVQYTKKSEEIEESIPFDVFLAMFARLNFLQYGERIVAINAETPWPLRNLYSDITFRNGGRTFRIMDENLKRAAQGRSLTADGNQYSLPYDVNVGLNIGIFREVYGDRLGVSELQNDTLENITFELFPYSTFILQAEAGTFEGLRGQEQVQKVQSGLIIVESPSAAVKLPSGILHGVDVRAMLPAGAMGILEIGRLGQRKGADSFVDLLKIAAMTMIFRRNIDYIVIEVDSVRRRMYKEKFGFVDIDLPEESQRPEYYRSGTDHLMYTTPERLINGLFAPAISVLEN